MNISKILLTGTIACMALASCTNENDYLDGTKPERGTMLLQVSRLMPQPKAASVETRAVETANFPVEVFRLNDGEKVLSYDQASLVPNKVTMAVGKYYATAHTPGTMQKIMDTPYYSGRGDFEIMKAVSTEAKVICRMANGSITMKLSADFATAFQDWTISLDDGSSTVISYNTNDGLNPATKYLDFEKNTKELKLNFRGTTTNGGRVTSSSVLTKKNASSQYEGDSEFFSGGDAIVINLKPAASTEGELPGIDITASITFEETEGNFDMEVEDVIQSGGGGNTGGGGDTPSEVTLNLPKDMEVSSDTDPSLGDAKMAAANGLKSIRVIIDTDSQDLKGILGEIAAGSPTVDFLKGVEVVANQDLVTFFADLGQTLTVPNQGDKEYTFPIGNFFTMISLVEGAHTIKVQVTDMNDQVQNGQVVLTVKPMQ